ncbi:MAG: glycosyltransferase family 2 protein [Chloroflexi bacterium]|nr:glycosyltransferase family 2 protein [Chloroflexota bacterium]
MTAVPLEFTVFTATYNRAHTLHRVYDGLRNQTYRNFEWLIIDDGSTDDTGEIVERWKREAQFPIRYFWQENRGKHIAHNEAINKAQGEFFIILDSDDSIIPAALERLLSLWKSIPSEQRMEFCGAAALCMDQHGNIIGKTLPHPLMDANILQMRFIHKRSQEFFGFYRLSILRQFPFPEIPDASFIPEGFVWSQIGQTYKIRYANEPLRVYYTEDSAFSLMRANPLSLAGSHSFWHQFTLNAEISWFRFDPLYFLSSAAHYTRFSLHGGKRLLTQFGGLNNWLARLLYLIMYPVGAAACYRDKIMDRQREQQ